MLGERGGKAFVQGAETRRACRVQGYALWVLVLDASHEALSRAAARSLGESAHIGNVRKRESEFNWQLRRQFHWINTLDDHKLRLQLDRPWSDLFERKLPHALGECAWRASRR